MTTRSPMVPRPTPILVYAQKAEALPAFCEKLSTAGFAPLCASDAEAALSIARLQKPDLILTALPDPASTDIDTLALLRAERPEARVILATHLSSTEALSAALRRGTQDYVIAYPPDADEVRQIAELVFERNKSREQQPRRDEAEQDGQRLREYTAELERRLEDALAANERLREQIKSRASFISTIAHELRHPLTVAKGYLELVTAESAPIDPETRAFIEIADQNLKNLAKMLDNLLDLSRIEAGHYFVDRQAERVGPLINQTLQAMGAAARARGITLKSELPEDLPRVWADPLRITQVLCNLVDNAIKFTQEQGTIVLTAHALPGQVEFIVADTGIGIPPSELERVFERFYQIKNPAVPVKEGAGLGLAICREIVRLHGGQIWATSEPSQGAELHFTLPVFTEAADETREPEQMSL